MVMSSICLVEFKFDVIQMFFTCSVSHSHFEFIYCVCVSACVSMCVCCLDPQSSCQDVSVNSNFSVFYCSFREAGTCKITEFIANKCDLKI